MIVHPNSLTTKNVAPGDAQALTLPKLGELVGSVRMLLQDMVSESMSDDALRALCEAKLDELSLRPQQIENSFLTAFVPESS